MKFSRIFDAVTFGSVLLLVTIGNHCVEPHGRLIEPPSRSSAWRYGFNTTANYNDHELYCGGFARQYQTNKGKCGICGDAYDVPQPRPNEAGGVYGQGVIVRKYRVDSIVRIKVELTANHKGHFEFRICPNNNPKKIATQKCLDTYVLQQSNGEGARYYPSEGSKVFESRFLLPRGLTCTQCVLQWRYIAGNNWGQCEDGTQAVGCGPQEEFRACADVSITNSTGHATTEPDNTDEDDRDNEVDKRKSDERFRPSTTEPTPRPEQQTALVFVMAIVGLMIAAIVFGALFGWFYRKEVLHFARVTINKPNWKLSSSGSQFIATRSTTSLPTVYASATQHGYHNSPQLGVNGRPTVPPPPVPPPRSKKTSTSDLDPPYSTDNYQNRLNSMDEPLKRTVTPDIISQPQPQSISVTINGLPI